MRGNCITLISVIFFTIFMFFTYVPLAIGSGKSVKETHASPTQLERSVLRLLIWEGHAPQAHIRKFEKKIEDKYGCKIKLQIRYMDGADSFYDLIRNGSVDMVMLTHDLLKDERFGFIKNKLILPLNLENIPNYKYLLPELQKADYSQSEGQVYACPESQGSYSLAYNTSLLKEEPKSWNILWDNQFKGKYVIGGNEYIYNALITALALGYPNDFLGRFDALNNPEYKAKLKELAMNANSFWHGVDKADDLSGHSLATVWGDSLRPLKQRGELWKVAKPVEGSPFWVDNCTITSALADKPFLKKIAEEYVNSLISTDYQVNIITRVIQTQPVVTNIDKYMTKEEIRRNHDSRKSKYKMDKRLLIPTYSERDRNGIKILWYDAVKAIAKEKDK